MPALAQHEPVIVIPGRPDVPVILNGYDVSGAVVEGDWGLERPGHVAPTIVDGPLIPAPYYARGDYLFGRGYYPGSGRRPGYGRKEIEPPPNRQLPRPAPSYHREWGIESAPNPVTEYPPYQTPSVIVAPNGDRRNMDGESDSDGGGQPGYGGSQGDGRRGPDGPQGPGRRDFDRYRRDGHRGVDGSQGDGRQGFDRTRANGPHGVARNQGKSKMPHHVR